MTETEWLDTERYEELYARVKHRRRCSTRVKFLLGAAACRSVAHLFPEPACSVAVDLVEKVAGGEVPADELPAMRRRVHEVYVPWQIPSESDAAYPGECYVAGVPHEARAAVLSCLCEDGLAVTDVFARVARLGGLHALDRARKILHYVDPKIWEKNCWEYVPEGQEFWAGYKAAQCALCRLLRDVFGNPFRPVKFAPVCRTSTVTALAREMYQSRDFSAMPILADALEDAGCENAEVLNHCRDPQGAHVPGCWVLDLVLDPEKASRRHKRTAEKDTS
jgi:hypothetical protein